MRCSVNKSFGSMNKGSRIVCGGFEKGACAAALALFSSNNKAELVVGVESGLWSVVGGCSIGKAKEPAPASPDKDGEANTDAGADVDVDAGVVLM